MIKTKWQLILAELKRKGWSQTDIAKAHGDVSQSAINYLNTGATKEPNYSVGDFLVRLNKFENKEAALQALACNKRKEVECE